MYDVWVSKYWLHPCVQVSQLVYQSVCLSELGIWVSQAELVLAV